MNALVDRLRRLDGDQVVAGLRAVAKFAAAAACAVETFRDETGSREPRRHVTGTSTSPNESPVWASPGPLRDR